MDEDFEISHEALALADAIGDNDVIPADVFDFCGEDDDDTVSIDLQLAREAFGLWSVRGDSEKVL